MKIFSNTETESDANRGQVGIGTLIVFIAMVLVAAIAAGVLINTAGFLQTQAEDTGTESTQQVADALNVITEVGEVSANDQINEVRMGVQPAAGANDINLAGLTLQFLSDDSFEELTIGEDTSTDEQAGGDANPDDIVLTNESSGSFLVEPTTAEDEEDVVMTDGSDRYQLVIPLDGTSQNWGQERVAFDNETAGNEDPLNGVLSPGDEFDIDGDEPFVASIDNVELDEDGEVTDLTDEFEIIEKEDEAGADIRYIGEEEFSDLDGGDTFTLNLTLTDVSPLAQGDLGPLEEGETAQVTITTDVGSQTVAFLQVPDSLVGPDAGETVNL